MNVKLSNINDLKASSDSQITSSNVLKTEKLDVTASSGSQIDIDVEADSITLESTSGSSIETTGKALKVEAYSTSGSEINAENLMANEVISQSSSGSSTSVYPILKLDAKVSSGSIIRYPKIPKQS